MTDNMRYISSEIHEYINNNKQTKIRDNVLNVFNRDIVSIVMTDDNSTYWFETRSSWYVPDYARAYIDRQIKKLYKGCLNLYEREVIL